MVGGPSLATEYLTWCEARVANWYDQTPETRRRQRLERRRFWMIPARNTTDRATCMVPGLMRSRLDKLGIDVALLYPTIGLVSLQAADPSWRRGLVRAVNTMNAELYGPYGDRLIPVAMIPMHTPDEALEELDHVVHTLGMKAVCLLGSVTRPIPEPSSGGFAPNFFVDYLAMDCDLDYDPVWQKCVELGVAVTSHTSSQGMPNRRSTSSFIFNHLGHLAQHHEGQCKAFVLGGVTNRFPTLKIAFLEGGVSWAVTLYNQMFEHWEKRNVEALKRNLDPALLDRRLLADLVAQFGDEKHIAKVGDIRAGKEPFWNQWRETGAELDEFAASSIRRPEDIYDRFVPNFYFGCEADDRMIPWAFDTKLNHFGARLKALFSSDIGHWDVNDATECLAESYELVEQGHLTPADFRDFTFTNAVTLHAGMNPAFFEGTVVADAAAKVMAGLGGERSAAGS